jgi:hypothetical protein
MKGFHTVLYLACLSAAFPLSDHSGPEQFTLTSSNYEVHPDFHLDLHALRLVEIDEGVLIWMTELEKVKLFLPSQHLSNKHSH